MKKILIIGGAGMVGRDVSNFLKNKYLVFIGTLNTDKKIKGCETIYLNIIDKKKTIKTISDINPNFIIHLAALTDVNLCEEKKGLARKINIEGTKNVVSAAKKVKAKLIYASTNYVFDGKKGMYNEEDIPNPINFYALTKLKGEKEVLRYDNSVVTRICPFGLGTKEDPSFILKLIQGLSNKRKMKIFTDQFFSPISNYNYAEALIKIIESNFTGIINIAGSERLSRYEFAKKIAEVFYLDSELLIPIKIKDLNEISKRPEDTSLDISKAKSLFGEMLLDAMSGIKLMKEYKKVNKNI